LLIYAQRLEPVGRPVRPGNWLVFDADESPPTGVGANVSPAPVIPPTLPEKVPLPVDALPVPLPAQVVGFEGGVGTFHPMLNADVLNAEQLAILQSSARIQVRKGGCVRAGDFSGDCLSLSPGRGPWQYYAHAQAEGVSVEVGDDSTGNQVLQISCDAEAAGKEISTGYQWLHVAPFEEGERMVLRFRARLVHGQVSFALAPSLPLRIASNDESELAKWLIESSRPAPFPPDGDGVQRWLQIKDWFTPSSDWTSFFVAFDWPPFCTIAKHRNLELYVRGRGEIWIDDVQLSPLKELAFAAETKEPSNSDDGRAR
jgi:hypothetical protein